MRGKATDADASISQLPYSQEFFDCFQQKPIPHTAELNLKVVPVKVRVAVVLVIAVVLKHRKKTKQNKK